MIKKQEREIPTNLFTFTEILKLIIKCKLQLSNLTIFNCYKGMGFYIHLLTLFKFNITATFHSDNSKLKNSYDYILGDKIIVYPLIRPICKNISFILIRPLSFNDL